jgi:glycosyltransferase involved in cell wall biosynthesis
LKRIYFTVTNDLDFDQRMHRICGSLVRAGFDVCLVGRKMKASRPLRKKAYQQKRLSCIFHKGFAFYAEYNLRLFFFLLFKKMDGVCAIDLDTILPALIVSKLKRAPRLYDAHEYFTELKEVRTRPLVRQAWLFIERICVPRYRWGYTVSEGIAEAFRKKYGRNYEVIRNLPVLTELTQVAKKERFLLYQGAVNEARGFEYLVPALRRIDARLVICGDGNFMSGLKRLVRKYGVKDQVEFMGMLLPDQLRPIAQQASLGIALAEKEGVNQFHALPNKFFEYMHAGLPQLAMAFPEYVRINNQYRIAVLLDDLSVEGIAGKINETLENEALLSELHRNCLQAREIYCWQNEERILLDYYEQIFGH